VDNSAVLLTDGNLCHRQVSPPPWDDFLHGFRSLDDVMQFAGDKYTDCCFKIHEIFGLAHFLDQDNADERMDTITETKIQLARLSVMAHGMGLDCADLINRIATKIDDESNAKHATDLIDEVQQAVLKNFKSRACFIMTPEETKLYQGKPLSSRAETAFPQSQRELTSGVRCLALGQAQACVFHSMTALEMPLGAQARYFGVQFGGVNTWGTAIVNIKDKIDKIERSKKLHRRLANDALAFHGEAAKEFSYFKDAWRNHVMHEGLPFDPDQARSVYNHVVSFVEHLSKRFSTRTRKRYKW
jgi:hypothetical protein